MRDRHLSGTRGMLGILILLAVVLGAFGSAAVGAAAGAAADEIDPGSGGGSSMGIVVTVPSHTAPSTPAPSQTPWPPNAPDDPGADPAGPDADGWLSATGLGWPALALAAAATFATLLGVALRTGSRRRA